MAGDWIPICVDLPGKPQVARMSVLVGKSTDEVVGLLIRFWGWAQRHTADGEIKGVGIVEAATASGVPPEFLEAMAEVGWLEIQDSVLVIPEFDRWFSGGAKRRLQERTRKKAAREAAKRPQNVRKTSAECPQTVRKTSASKADEVRTTEKKEKKNTIPPPINPPPQPKSAQPSQELDCSTIDLPPEYDTPEVRAAIADWLDYRRRIKKPYKCPERQLPLLVRQYGRDFPAAVRHSIAQGYQGCFLPDKPNGRTKDASRNVGPGQRHPADLNDW